MDKEKNLKDLKIGFIGQGWIGRHYADNFVDRGYENIVRYDNDEFKNNGEKLADCEIVFIAVPTPSTPDGFDYSIIKEVLKKVGPGKIAVIKSTMMPGTTEIVQSENPGIFVLHSPEFLAEMTAAYDAANPNRNIVGLPVMSEEYKEKAKLVIEVLPPAPYDSICYAREAELIKYGGNNWLYFRVVFVNMLYDLSKSLGCQWETIRDGMAADPRIGKSHMEPIHKSGRGAGGHCFIKDFAALTQIYKEQVSDEFGIALLESMKNKNLDLLISSDKDLDLLKGVYGEDVADLKGKNKITH